MNANLISLMLSAKIIAAIEGSASCAGRSVKPKAKVDFFTWDLSASSPLVLKRDLRSSRLLDPRIVNMEGSWGSNNLVPCRPRRDDQRSGSFAYPRKPKHSV
jgi:hypothetical protein